MEAKDQVDDRTFRVNFSLEGAAKLRERVMEKLKEFMGEYTDETLVEYVMVLLRNGRHKEEAKSELDVFLGDDSDSFVNWLWDHLASNLNQYIQAPESSLGEILKTKPTFEDHARRKKFQHLDSESDQGKAARVSKSRRKREWKGLKRDASQPSLLYSTVTEDVPSESKEHHNNANHTRQSVSQNIRFQRKRSHADECEQPKIAMDAPKRLLQFAVRDAVATTRSSSAFSEPTAKRLRSMVSTCSSESAQEAHPQRKQSVARQPNALAAAIKAVAEAAQDVVRVRSSTRNVFDRLSHEIVVPESIDQGPISRQHAVKVEEFEYYSQPHGEIHPVDYYQPQVQDELVDYCQPQVEDNHVDYYLTPEKQQQIYVQRKDYGGEYFGNTNMMQSDTGMTSDSASDNVGYENVSIMEHRHMDASQIGSSSERKRDDSLMLQYSVAQDTDEVVRQARIKSQDPSVPTANTSRKILNISVNVNTWKPPHYQSPCDATELDIQQPLQQTEVGSSKSSILFMKENDNSFAVNGNGKPAVPKLINEAQKGTASMPGSYSSAQSLEDADSRTIFVNNVHYGATKDSLSRHFNQCGAVLKVIILTDAATGQPRGSAYVEFLCKEAAENSLSLDGTYFMARMLKVVRKSSVPQEATPMMTWSRVARCIKYSWVPFPRGSYRPGAYMMVRAPIKPGGARSMQWKRNAQSTSANSSATALTTTSAGRGLTCVRTVPKPTGNKKAAC